MSSRLAPPARYFTTKQDHFDEQNKNTWEQAYFVNDEYFIPHSNAPVFLCVGGEGPLDGSAVVRSYHCNLAVEWLPETGALMLAVEHRYYGCHNTSACPYNAETKDPLQFLSSKQALADLSSFVTFSSKEFNLTKKNKWIVWGGSYPGMLAGWFRLKYPNLVHAAVASSGPVLAKLDMQEFNNIVARAYSVEYVGGSTACQKAIADGHVSVGKLLQSDTGRQTLAKLFPTRVSSASWLEDRVNQRHFAGCGVASFPAQGNNPASHEAASNIKTICEVMIDTSIGDPINRLASLVEKQGRSATDCEMDWTKYSIHHRTKKDSPDVSHNYWGYQTCTEFGFYQTCEVGSQCFYTQGLISFNDPSKHPDSFCLAEFGISEEETKKHIDETNNYYGGLAPNGTRIFWPNGEVDPWSGLSILKSPGPEQPVLMVAGASHHAWTHPSSNSDLQSIVDARKKIKTQVAAWLKED